MLRRSLDIVFASVVLVAISPLLILIGLLVMMDSQGSPFYGGWRAGKGGRPFRMWKFRSMVANADQMGAPVTTRRDSRITRVGGILRKTKLDELPQFFNLLMGDLTLVGPRPEDCGIVSQYTAEQRQVLNVRPGITGPTQLRYTIVEAEAIPDGAEWQEYYINQILSQKLQMDLDYLRRRTAISDLQIILQTVLLMARISAKDKTRISPSLSPTHRQ